MDAMLEQEKDAKLYELICRSLLSDKDLRKVLLLSRNCFLSLTTSYHCPFLLHRLLKRVDMMMKKMNG